MANSIYNRAMLRIMNKEIDFDTDDFRCLLLKNSEAFVKTDVFVNDLTGANIMNVRATLAGESLTQDDTNDRIEFDANDAVFTAINDGTATALVLYRHVTDDTDAELIAFFDTLSPGFPIVTDGTDVTIVWHADGILHLQQG